MIITFVGHSSLANTDLLAENVRGTIEKNIEHEENVSFYCGGYGDFDNVCAKVCAELKSEIRKCEVVLVTPYITESFQGKLQMYKESNLYDSIVYPPIENTPLKYAISVRNNWMIDKADIIIAYVKYTFGGAYKSLGYARRKKKKIINLAELEL